MFYSSFISMHWLTGTGHSRDSASLRSGYCRSPRPETNVYFLLHRHGRCKSRTRIAKQLHSTSDLTNASKRRFLGNRRSGERRRWRYHHVRGKRHLRRLCLTWRHHGTHGCSHPRWYHWPICRLALDLLVPIDLLNCSLDPTYSLYARNVPQCGRQWIHSPSVLLPKYYGCFPTSAPSAKGLDDQP